MTNDGRATTIGAYTFSLDAGGALTIYTAGMNAPITLDAGQARALLQWLNAQQTVLKAPPPSAQSSQPSAQSVEKPEDIARRAIDEVISAARTHYPASLEPENRDRFIEQTTRNPSIRVLLSQGSITRKQVALWIDQRLGY